MNHVKNQDHTLTMRIETLMLALHVPAHLMGFRYLARAIYLVYSDPSLLYHVVEGLYTMAAADMGTSLSRFERDMRTALKKVPTSDYSTTFAYHFDPETQHITPKEFIALCVSKLRREDIEAKKEQ